MFPFNCLKWHLHFVVNYSDGCIFTTITSLQNLILMLLSKIWPVNQTSKVGFKWSNRISVFVNFAVITWLHAISLTDLLKNELFSLPILLISLELDSPQFHFNSSIWLVNFFWLTLFLSTCIQLSHYDNFMSQPLLIAVNVSLSNHTPGVYSFNTVRIGFVYFSEHYYNFYYQFSPRQILTLMRGIIPAWVTTPYLLISLTKNKKGPQLNKQSCPLICWGALSPSSCVVVKTRHGM